MLGCSMLSIIWIFVISLEKGRILCSKSRIVHEEQVNVGRVVYKEGFMARRHQVASFLVRAISNLEGRSD